MRTVVLVGVTALLLLTGGCEGDDPPTSTGDPSPDAGTRAAAERFAPAVWLATGEKNLPMDADRFVGESELWFDYHCRIPLPEKVVAKDVDGARLGGHGEGPYTTTDCANAASALATDKDAADAGDFYLDPPDTDEARGGDGPSAPAYWEFYDKGDGRTTAYVYWLFYGYNDFVNNHEGDWERVAVRLVDDEPAGLTFWKHNEGPCTVDWSDAEKLDGHPVTYAAIGSHGSYHRAGAYAATTTVPGITDETSAGTRWSTWDTARPVVDQAWWGFRGLWGSQDGIEGTNGPRGPYPGRAESVFADKVCTGPLEPTATPGPPVPTTTVAPVSADHYRHSYPGSGESYYYFTSADGRYSCGFDVHEAVCQGETEPIPPRPADCQEGWGNGMVVDAQKVDFLCAGGLIFGPAGRSPEPRDVLPPGQAISALGFTCSGEDTGIRCAHDSSRHGFLIAAHSNERF